MCGMKARARNISHVPAPIRPLPNWIVEGDGGTPEDQAFLSGGALAHLHGALKHPELPFGLLRDRRALGAAEACVTFSGRPERSPDLRDALNLIRPGDDPGPAGTVFLAWRRATERPISIEALSRAMPTLDPNQIAVWLDASIANPVDAAAVVFRLVLAEAPRADVPALILAEATIARALGWSHIIPLLATGLKRRDLAKEDDALRMAMHRAVVVGVKDTMRQMAELVRRRNYLMTVAPKLRAKASEAVVAAFLNRDALTPFALTQYMSDRAARRICERLVSLDAVRELTGRESFRIYGV